MFVPEIRIWVLVLFLLIVGDGAAGQFPPSDGFLLFFALLIAIPSTVLSITLWKLELKRGESRTDKHDELIRKIIELENPTVDFEGADNRAVFREYDPNGRLQVMSLGELNDYLKQREEIYALKTSFVVRRRILNISFWALITILFFWPPLVIAILLELEAPSSLDSEGIWIFAITSVIAVVGTAPTINSLIWKCTVQGEQIKYRSLFYRKNFTFQNIERVAFRKRTWRYYHRETDISFWHIFLKGKRLPIKVPANGFNTSDFAHCLRQKNIPDS